MSNCTAPRDAGATRAALPFANIVLAVALLAGLGGALRLDTVLASLASPGEATVAGPAAVSPAVPARARSVTYTDSSVPDAGSALAGQPDRIEELAPTF